MKTFILLGLTAAASALDIALFAFTQNNNGDNCPGGDARRALCTNVNPNTCCGTPNGGFASIGFFGIVPEWNIEVRGYEGGNCARTRDARTTSGTNFQCLTNRPFTGGQYGFLGRKRRSELVAEAQAECQMPDTFYDGDGKIYDLLDLDDDHTADFLQHGFNGSIPEEYKKYEVKK